MVEEIEEFEAPDTPIIEEPEQRILTINQFINEYIKGYGGFGEPIRSCQIYLFPDKCQTIIKDVYFQPLLVRLLGMTNRTLKFIYRAELKEKFGENFGLKFKTSKLCYLHPKINVNVLKINLKEKSFMKGSKSINYYDKRNYGAFSYDSVATAIYKKLHQSEPVFKRNYSPTAKFYMEPSEGFDCSQLINDEQEFDNGAI
jgi:hypothetical protein